MTRLEKCWGIDTGKANRKEGDRLGVGAGTEQVVEGNGPNGGHRQLCARRYSACWGEPWDGRGQTIVAVSFP